MEKDEGKVYRMTGTLSELQYVLQSQFDMQEKEAKLAVYMLILEQNSNLDVQDEKNMTFWYLNDEQRYSTPVFKSRYSISFTDVRKEIMDQLIGQFAAAVIDHDKISLSIIVGCLLAVYRSGTCIKPEECCVYYQAIQWKMMHRTQEYFRIEDILPKDPEGVCVCLDKIKDKKWKCNFCHTDECGADEQKFKAILDALCARNVFTEDQGMYQFMK